MQWIEVFGYLGALLTLTTFSMKTMLRLRMVGIVSNLAFITYGALSHAYPVLLLHLVLLPLNVWRLRQLLQLTHQIKNAAKGSFSVDWLMPFSRRRAVHAGEVLFKQGDPAGELMYVLSGQFRAVEANVPIEMGQFIGELGLVTKGQRRTQTVVCEQAGSLLILTFDEVRQMYYQNPKFGFYFLELVAERLIRDANQLKSAMHTGPAQPADTQNAA
jgi:CRP/FNR family transcriptional regulator, cyclic AMP receptor protein